MTTNTDPLTEQPIRAIINTDIPGPLASRHLFGHFAEHLGRCIYDGIWVGPDSPVANIDGLRADVVEALRQLHIPNLRWPGGCFADEYHWRDGIGERQQRPRMVNSHWGDVVEDNSFGTHEFLALCEAIGAEPYISGNLGSGTVREMSEWYEYITREDDSPMSTLRRANGREQPWRLKFFGIGNENWGCGGHMNAAHYANQARNYATYVRAHGDNQPYRIACGPSDADYAWTETLMKTFGDLTCPKCDPTPLHALSLHYYTFTGDWEDKGDATDFTVDQWYRAFDKAWQIDRLLTRHGHVMDVYDPDKKVGLVVDEWGAWWNPTPGSRPGFLVQQNSLRDALIAVLHFEAFLAHADRVVMANIAQTVNVLQAVLETDPATGALIKTPTYHAFSMNIPHMDAAVFPVQLLDAPVMPGEFRDLSLVHAYASGRDGCLTISLTNLSADQDAELTIDLRGGEFAEDVAGLILTAPAINSINSAEALETVMPQPFDDASFNGGLLGVRLPAHSHVQLQIAGVFDRWRG
ncbi:MAG: alpha-N-arabinofuranosidase [Propionibacteriaceae bacterium]|jgi:alpha-N-arabinofuranosidase|nr:alpha-N-arabinofuranosidase [Propionibacteriaceae bacterium]